MDSDKAFTWKVYIRSDVDSNYFYVMFPIVREMTWVNISINKNTNVKREGKNLSKLLVESGPGSDVGNLKM